MSDQERGNESQGSDADKDFDAEWDRLAEVDAQGPASDEDAPGDRHDSLPDDGEGTDTSGQPSPGGTDGGERQGPDAEDALPAGSEKADDPWADATPAQLEAKAALEAKIGEEAARAGKAENVIRANTGRWSKAERELNELRAKVAQPAPEGDAATAAGKKGAKPEDLERLAKEYDDFAPPIVDELTSLREIVQRLEGDATKRADLEQAQAALEKAELYDANERAVTDKHSDWGAILPTQEFADWALAQPLMVRDALLRNADAFVDSAEAIKILDDYKRDKGLSSAPDPLAEKRERQLEGGRLAPGRTGTAPRTRGDASTYDEEWDRLEAEDNRRQRARGAR